MTFTEQDSQEILDELNEEEAPDPVDQMFGAIGDLGENLVDPNVVLGPTFGGGDKWWQVPTLLPPPFGGLLGAYRWSGRTGVPSRSVNDTYDSAHTGHTDHSGTDYGR